MPADVIVYAVVAAGLVFWLRSILGTRHGEERERPNPYNRSDDISKKGESEAPPAASHNPVSTVEQNIVALGAVAGPLYSIENKTAENALLDIAEQDKDFNAEFFMEAARDVFVMIVEAFSSGDKDTLKDLLADPVYRSFDEAIEERKERGETMETKVHVIRKAEIIEADIEGSMAYITVRFVADESSVQKNSAGEILSGDPDKLNQIIDIWTFGHTLGGDDPRWLVHQTRSDDPDDNDMIPNTH